MILGGGSNILFSDEGFDGLVIRLVNREIDLSGEEEITCQAGIMLCELVAFATEHSLAGMEWAAGIPGTVGGAVRGNAGAYGQEMKDAVVRVKYFDLEKLEEQICDSTGCRFDYRESVFKEFDHKIIWEVILQLKKGEKKAIESLVQEIIQKRKQAHPRLAEFGSAGCIFKNPVVDERLVKEFEAETGAKSENNKIPAGWLIDMCGMKGYRMGAVQVSEKQANFIVNQGDGKAEEVVVLISLIKMKVRNNFGVQLEEEVVLVGF